MSFSPELDGVLGIRIANIFATPGSAATADSTPYPGYYTSEDPTWPTAFLDRLSETFPTTYASDSVILGSVIDFREEPIIFPTLDYAYSHLGEFGGTVAGGDNYDRLFTATVLVDRPEVSAATSGFMNWRTGFGFGFSSALYYYEHGTVGSTDRSMGRAGEIGLDDGTEGMYPYVRSAIFVDHKCERAKRYVESHLVGSPYQCIQTEHNIFGDKTEYGEAIYTTATPGVRYTSVLYSTSVKALTPDSVCMGATTEWVRPVDMVPTFVESNMHLYPAVATMIGKTDVFSGDVRLFKATFDHNYTDAGYNYVKDDIIERFKTVDKIIDQRDHYINSRVVELNNLLAATFEVPKELRTKRQPSIKLKRQNYTTFDYDDTIAISPSSETTMASTASPTSTMGSGGTSGGGGAY